MKQPFEVAAIGNLRMRKLKNPLKTLVNNPFLTSSPWAVSSSCAAAVLGDQGTISWLAAAGREAKVAASWLWMASSWQRGTGSSEVVRGNSKGYSLCYRPGTQQRTLEAPSDSRCLLEPRTVEPRRIITRFETIA